MMPTNTFPRFFATALAAGMLLSEVAANEPPIREPQPPAISQRTFTITDFGAVGDGTAINTDAFRAAIQACGRAGGGRVVVPAGTFLTGPIELASHTALV